MYEATLDLLDRLTAQARASLFRQLQKTPHGNEGRDIRRHINELDGAFRKARKDVTHPPEAKPPTAGVSPELLRLLELLTATGKQILYDQLRGTEQSQPQAAIVRQVENLSHCMCDVREKYKGGA